MKKEEFVMADRFRIAVQTECAPALDYLRNNADEFARLTISFLPQTAAGEVSMRFIYEDTDALCVDFHPKDRVMHLECPWRQIDESTILPMMFRQMVEWLRQSEKEIKLHASAVERDGAAALFLAPSEGGKTTTALAMCRQYSCVMRSNDAAVVRFFEDTPLLLRGDTAFKVRQNGLEAYSRTLFAEKVSENDTEKLPWYSKLKLTADEMGVVAANSATPVRLMFFIRLDPLVEGLRVTEYTDSAQERRQFWFKPTMMVLQNISGTMRGVDLIPVGNDGMLLPLDIPSVDTLAFSGYRSEFLNKLFLNCRVFQLRGQLAPMTAFIDRMLTEAERMRG